MLEKSLERTVFKEAIHKGIMAVLTQSGLLEFERVLASAPEVYDYSSNIISTFQVIGQVFPPALSIVLFVAQP